MKTLTYRRDLLLKFGLPLIIVGAIAYFALGPQLSDLFYLHWLTIPALILILGSPLRSMRLGDCDSPHSTWFRKSILLWLFQLALFGSYFLFCHLLQTVLPIPTSLSSMSTLQLYLTHFGLFPWCAAAVIAVGLAYYGYIRQQDTYINTVSSDIIKNSPTSTLGVIVNVVTRTISQQTITINLGIFTIAGMMYFFKGTIALHFGWSIATIITVILLIVVLHFMKKDSIQQKITNSNFGLLPSLILSCCVLALLIGLILGIMQFTTHKFTLQPVALVSRINNFDPHLIWQGIGACWWALWIPIIATFWAGLSRGLTVIQSIISMLILPLVLTILLSFSLPHSVIATISQFFSQSTIALIITALCYLGVLIVLTKKTFHPKLLYCCLPSNNHYKFRSATMLQKNLLTGVISTIALVILDKIYILSWVLTCLTVASTLALLITAIAFSLYCIRNPKTVADDQPSDNASDKMTIEPPLKSG